MVSARFRVLSLIVKNGVIHQHQSSRAFSSNNPLLTRLLQEPISRIGAILDSGINPTPNSKTLEISWDDLVSRLKFSNLKKAQLVLEWRLDKLTKEKSKNPDCYSELIYLSAKIQNLPIALRVFTSMENHAIKPTAAVFNALICACLSSGNVVTALSLFETMGFSDDYKPDSHTYNVFMLAYAKLGNDKAVQAWYSAKRNAGFSADLQMYQYLISRCIESKKFGYADRFYEEMTLAGIVPNVPVLQGMLTGYCERKNSDKALEFFKFVLNGGWEINIFMVEKLVGLYTNIRKVEDIEQLLQILEKTDKDLQVQALIHCGIIRVYALLGRLDDVEYAVGRMLKKGMSFRCPDDVENIICLYLRKEAYDRLDLFLECIKDTCTLTKSTYDLLVDGYRRVGLEEKLDVIVNDMKVAGFS